MHRYIPLALSGCMRLLFLDSLHITNLSVGQSAVLKGNFLSAQSIYCRIKFGGVATNYITTALLHGNH